MTRRRWSLAALCALIVILAFILRDFAAAVIIPAAFVWWLLKLYYAAVPQAIIWILLVAFAAHSALTTSASAIQIRAARKAEIRVAQGRVEILAEWIKKSKRGAYYKWLVANRLGKAAREILAQREGKPVSKSFGGLNGRGWNPPPEIGAYLENGLLGSFASFPRPRWFWQKPLPTPLDLEARQALDYLEDEMEMEHDRDSKSI
jgi:hypothetical protein